MPPKQISISEFNGIIFVNKAVFITRLFQLSFCFFFFIAGLVNKFLSASYWIPLSRLTYSAYLLHPIVLGSYFGSFEQTIEYSDKNFVSLVNNISTGSFIGLECNSILP